ncbi:tryptophan aminotransferase related 1 [Euphorbia peplus]|nr:tryptophan aminotransferase related 1 [Euphorbia peplus]
MSTKSSKYYYKLILGISVIVNLIFIYKVSYNKSEERWTRKAAEEAEKVAAITCSGHGRAFLDGFNTCECNSCYGGSDCSLLYPSCAVNVDGGDPLFLEPFWVQNAASSAVVVAGWHRMSYSFGDQSFVSKELENAIRNLHSKVGNAVTQGRYIIFGAGSTQLLNAAVRSLSPHNSSSPANIVASIPFYPVYELQTEYVRSVDFSFQGDTSLWKNKSNVRQDMIEFVTSPNNPDGHLKNPVLQGPNVQVIYDHAYYWPHFTAIPAPADGDMTIFTLSKLTGHAGSRFGWAIVKDKAIYEKMVTYMQLNTMGVSRETQLRALKLLKVVLEEGENGIFLFGHDTMKKRWERLNEIISMTDRFSLQKVAPEYCTYLNKVRNATPAYGWLKCEREEDKDCYAVLQAANMIGREGPRFYAGDQYVRVSLIRSQDDFDLFIDKLKELVSKEEDDGPKSI